MHARFDPSASALAGQLEFLMDKGIAIFDQVSKVPVTLSLYIVVLSTASEGAVKLPGDLFELYETALWTVIKNRFDNDGLQAVGSQWVDEGEWIGNNQPKGTEINGAGALALIERLQKNAAASGELITLVADEKGSLKLLLGKLRPQLVTDSYVRSKSGRVFRLGGDVMVAYNMLKKVGCHNHVRLALGKDAQRVFKTADIKDALGPGTPEMRLWDKLALENLGVPLVKTLSLGEEGEFRAS